MKPGKHVAGMFFRQSWWDSILARAGYRLVDAGWQHLIAPYGTPVIRNIMEKRLRDEAR